MAAYDSSDFDRMRQEAVARAREMQRRAQGLVNPQAAARSEMPPPSPSPQTAQADASDRQAGAPAQSPAVGGLLSSIFGSDGVLDKIDEEKALIGLLIYILYKNGADVKLMLALGYLLL